MKGLLAEKLMLVKRGIKSYLITFILFFAIAIMIVLSTRYGNLKDFDSEAIKQFSFISALLVVTIIAMLIPSVMITTNIAVEDTLGFQRKYLCLPITAKTYVLSTYMSLVIAFGCMFPIAVLLQFIITSLSPFPYTQNDFLWAVVTFCCIIILYSVLALGAFVSKTARTFLNMSLFLMPMVLAFSSSGEEADPDAFVQSFWWAFLIGAAVILTLSVVISVITFERRIRA